jgi:hypothetical protein
VSRAAGRAGLRAEAVLQVAATALTCCGAHTERRLVAKMVPGRYGWKSAHRTARLFYGKRVFLMCAFVGLRSEHELPELFEPLIQI